VTAKEKLLERVMKLSEAEADKTLRLLDEREDSVIAAFREAPEDDETLNPEEEAVLAESREQYRRGEAVPLDDIRHEFS
jgi:hypothetical protein